MSLFLERSQRPQLLSAILTGAVFSIVNVVKTEWNFRSSPLTVGYEDIAQGTPLHFIRSGFLTPFFIEWLFYVVLFSFLITRLFPSRINFLQTLTTSLISFVAVAVLASLILNFIQMLNQAPLTG
jgi:hypothetical protein